MKKKNTLVIIDRKKWYRGQSDMNSRLRGDFGTVGHRKMCCLGFACIALGAKLKEIRGVAMPDELERVFAGLNSSAGGYMSNTIFTDRAAEINDNVAINDTEREKQLKTLAKESGFTFQFVN